MSVTTIEQSVPSGSIMTGAAPAAEAVGVQDIRAHPIEAGSGAGLFDFKNDRPYVIHQVFLKLGGQTAYSITHVDRNGVETILFTGGAEAFYLSTTENGGAVSGLILFEGETLLVKTNVNATNDIIARVSADQLRA